MEQNLSPGDFLVFQLEAAFGLLRLLAVDDVGGEKVWHVAAYNDLFLDVETAETATASQLSVSIAHVALTDRAFHSTQVARISNAPLTDAERNILEKWLETVPLEVSDRSIRLLLGLR